MTSPVTVGENDTIPGWTCARARYGDGTCDCGCGATDADCVVSAVSADCASATAVCWDGVCAEVGWTVSAKDGQGHVACDRARYGTDGVCDLGCGDRGLASLDPDCLVPGAAQATPGVQRACDLASNTCGPDAWTCAAELYNGTVCQCASRCGLADPGCADRAANTSCADNFVCADDRCDHPRNWTCGDGEYNTSGVCNCGCGAYDPDCDAPGCEVVGCPTGTVHSCRANASCAVAVCGNGFVDLPLDEECDGGLGCSARCRCNARYEPYPGARRPACHPVCGDRTVVEGEECDSTGGCLANCTCDARLRAVDGRCVGCGNGAREAGEDCDLGAHCDNATCTCLPGFRVDRGSTGCVRGTNVAAAVAVPIVLVLALAGAGTAGFLVWRRRRAAAAAAQDAAATDAAVVAAAAAAADSVAMDRLKGGGGGGGDLLSMTGTALVTTAGTAGARATVTQAVRTGVPATHLDQWGVEPAVADFGAGGAPVDVGVALTQTFVIKNLGLAGFRYAVSVPAANRFLLRAVPAAGTVDAGYSLAFRLTGVLYCTATVTDAPVVVSVAFTDAAGQAVEEYVALPLYLQGTPSMRIDYDDLVFDRVIGEGSFGAVYRGSYQGQPAAIKTLKAMNESALSDFVREIDMLGRLRNPYVLTFFGAVITHDKLCMVTEYMALGSLGAVLKKYALSPRLKVRLALDTVRGLAFLHEMNVLHRDIKPGNVLCSSLDLSAPILCKISDFGTSRVTTEGAPQQQMQAQQAQQAQQQAQQQQNKGMGTPLYMAPEIFNDTMPYSKASDVFSFGIMLAQIWNERTPYFDCHFDTPWALAAHVTAGNRPTVLDGCPAALLQLMQQCWAASPAQRPTFADCAAYLAQLNDLFDQQGDAPGTVHVVEKKDVQK